MQYHNLHLKQNEHSHSLIWWLLFEESTLLLAFYVKLQVLTKRLKFTVACLARMAGHRCKYLLINATVTVCWSSQTQGVKLLFS